LIDGNRLQGVLRKTAKEAVKTAANETASLIRLQLDCHEETQRVLAAGEKAEAKRLQQEARDQRQALDAAYAELLLMQQGRG
jgi:hypothetical protein